MAREIDQLFDILNIQVRNLKLHPDVIRIFIVLVYNTGNEHLLLFFDFDCDHEIQALFLKAPVQNRQDLIHDRYRLKV